MAAQLGAQQRRPQALAKAGQLGGGVDRTLSGLGVCAGAGAGS